MDLSDAEAMAPGDNGAGVGGTPGGQGVAGVTFDPTMTNIASPRTRRDSAGSSVSDASGLFPIYEVPGVSFNMPQVQYSIGIVNLQDLGCMLNKRMSWVKIFP